MKVQAHSSLEPPVESEPDVFDESRFIMTFSTILEAHQDYSSLKKI